MAESPPNIDQNPVYKMIQGIIDNIEKDLETGNLNATSAITLLERQLGIADKLQSLLLKGRIYQTLGTIHRQLNHFDQAKANFDRALDIYIDIEDDRLTATTLCSLGELQRQAKNIERAFDYFEKSRHLAEKLSDVRLTVANYCNEGQLWLMVGQIDRSLKVLTKGLMLADESAFDAQILYRLLPEMKSSLGEAYARQGEFKTAHAHVGRSLAIAQEHHQVRQIAHAYQVMGIIATLEETSAEEVRGNFEKSLELWASLGANANCAYVLMLHADYWKQAGQPQQAADLYHHAANYFDEANLPAAAQNARQKATPSQ